MKKFNHKIYFYNLLRQILITILRTLMSIIFNLKILKYIFLIKYLVLFKPH